MYANKPGMAGEWQKETPKKNLPAKKKRTRSERRTP